MLLGRAQQKTVSCFEKDSRESKIHSLWGEMISEKNLDEAISMQSKGLSLYHCGLNIRITDLEQILK